jgi:tetratricopeptide (TPR) repeat protein
MSHSEPNRQADKAQALFEEAYRRQMAGEIDEAVRLYQASLTVHPTPEAHTFLGWSYNFQGRVDEAIVECQKAILLDPDFGNPYNDIGVYLIEQGKLDEAIPWLKRAKLAKRYDARHYPFLNLGRIYTTKGLLNMALEEYKGALELSPEDTAARGGIEGIRRQMN